jgi:integrase
MWRIRWIDENGTRRSEVYSKKDDAVFKLREHEHHVEQIRRRLRSPDPVDVRFDDVDDYWLKVRAANKRSRACDESILRAHLRPAFSGKRLAEIGVKEIDVFKASKGHLHLNTLHHILTLLISLLRVAVELNWLRVMPVVKKPRIKLFSKDFHYLRTEEEISRFLRSAKDEGEEEFALYSTAVYTGLRQGELAALLWANVDFATRLITVQASWDGPTKNGEARHVPILDVLLPVLREWRLRCPGKYVFPNSEGGMYARCARIFQESLQSILDRAELPRVQRHGKLRRYIRFHDLRHTFASHWMMKGGDLFRLQAILGHASPQMTMRYAHLAPAAFAADWGRLGKAAPGTEATVLPLNPESGSVRDGATSA